jgi:hypothetical protein
MSLPPMRDKNTMALMGSVRTSARWLRLALAALFAIGTMIQVPAMAIACATKSSQLVAASFADHHHSHSGHHQHHADVATDVVDADVTHDASVCQAMGCCMAIDPAVAPTPVAMDILIGLLDQAPARVMLPALPEPADPPPRLQV